MPSTETREIVRTILNEPNEEPTKKKRGRKPKNKESNENDCAKTNETAEKAPENTYLLRLRKRKD